MDYLTVGHIVKTIGLKGELKIYPTTNFRDSRFKAKSHLFVFNEKTNERIEVIVKSHHKNGNFKKLHTFDDTKVHGDGNNWDDERASYWMERAKTM